LLVALRFIQGAALGGEWAGAVLLSVEHGSEGRRGLNAAWTQMGPSVGTLFATGSIAVITFTLAPEEFLSWGWRLPFFASLALVLFGLWIRRGVAETPVFEDLERRQQKSQAPIAEVFRSHWKSLLRVGGVRVGPDVFYSLTAVFTLSYLTTMLGLSRTLALTALSIGGVFNAFSMLFFGSLSDKIGRRAVYGTGVVLALLWVFAFFPLLDSRQPVLIVLAIVVALTVHAMMYGPQAAFIAEQFPNRVRYAGASLAYTMAGIFGGGIAPVMFATLMKSYGQPFAISIYAAVALAITGIVLSLPISAAARGLNSEQIARR
jgi:MFS family permease